MNEHSETQRTVLDITDELSRIGTRRRKLYEEKLAMQGAINRTSKEDAELRERQSELEKSLDVLIYGTSPRPY